VTPLRSQPAVVEVQPTDHSTNVECTVDGVEDVRGTGHASTIGDDGAGDNRSEQVGAGFELEGLKTTSKCVEEDVTSSVELYDGDIPLALM
jgi:hypothetical protein